MRAHTHVPVLFIKYWKTPNLESGTPNMCGMSSDGHMEVKGFFSLLDAIHKKSFFFCTVIELLTYILNPSGQRS